MTQNEIFDAIMELADQTPNTLVVFNCGHVRVVGYDRDVQTLGAEPLFVREFGAQWLDCYSYLLSRN